MLSRATFVSGATSVRPVSGSANIGRRALEYADRPMLSAGRRPMLGP
jgi:hypothetical protein